MNVFFIKSIHSIITYSVDAAASGGPYSRGNSSQTPSRYSWALTPGWTGPCGQTHSDEQNTGRIGSQHIKCF